MNQLIEYIGREGVMTTNLEIIHSRWSNPREGDVVDFSLMAGEYPFTQGQYGTVDSIGRGLCRQDEISICSHMGSIFLSWDEKKREPTVSISGGPFENVKRSRLEPMFQLRTQTMWNWGNNGAGAHMGVYYKIDRPVFRLLPK